MPLQFLFIIILLKLTSSQSLVYDFDALNQNIDYWQSNSILAFTQCNGINILGGYNIFDMNTKLSTVIRFLDPHDVIRIKVTFWRIDSWDSDSINFDINGIRQFNKTYQYSNQVDQCGMTQYDDQMDEFTFNINHNSNSVSVLIYAIDSNGDNNESWGIQKFQIYIQQCRYDYFNQECYNYLDWQQVYQFFTLSTLVNYEGWSSDYPDIRYVNSIYFIHYHFYMQQTLTLPVHTQLKIAFYGNGEFQFYIDSQLVFQTYVDQFQIFQFKTYNTIKLQGSDHCKYIRDFYVFVDKCGITYSLPQIIKECLTYQNIKCIECNEGWQLNSVINQCQTICGDNLIRGNEECEDNNDDPNDGCDKCKYQCDKNCDICIFGQCSICKQGFQLNNNRCEELCKMHFLKKFQLEKQQICPLVFQPQTINLLQYEQILKVDKLNIDSFVGICGDGILNGTEECDDLNDNQCYQCKLLCDFHCEVCQLGQCKVCEQGFQLKNNKCEIKCQDGDQLYLKNNSGKQLLRLLFFEFSSCAFNQRIGTCGDGVINGFEECDDGNELQSDKCNNKCFFGNCQGCSTGYILLDLVCYQESQVIFQQINSYNCLENLEVSSLSLNYQGTQLFQNLIEFYYLTGMDEQCLYYNSNQCFNVNNSCICDPYCQICDKDKCLSCQSDYFLNQGKCENINFIQYREIPMQSVMCLIYPDNLNYNKIDQILLSRFYCLNQELRYCGNGIIGENEKCDNSNDISNEVCYICQFQCDLNCLDCNFGICQKCKSEYILVQNRCEIYCNLPIYLDRSNNKNTEFSSISVPMNYFCYPTEFQQILLDYQKFSLSYCGDGVVNNFEDCDDQNDDYYDGCYQCKFQCHFFCDDCFFGVCLKCSQNFELVGQICKIIVESYTIIPANKFEIDSLLIDTSSYFDQFAESINALNNYSTNVEDVIVEIKQDEYQYIYSGSDSIYQQIKIINKQSNLIQIQYFINGEPESICGNKLIEGFEECDDGNDLPFDGCYQCQFQCDYICDSCQYGVCLNCKKYYEIHDKSMCQPICNDKVLVPYSTEQCDDGNTIQGDGCFNCKYQCSEYCVKCFKSACLQCELNFSLINNFCLCWNGFELINKKCQMQCQGGFHLINNVCVEQCKDGFEYFDDSCRPFCGDQKVITDLEECDDGNLDQYDGCFNCKFSCPLNCDVCFKGECKQCNKNYEITSKLCTLIQIINESQIEENNNTNQTNIANQLLVIDLCGNGVIDEDEKCDDGNILAGDGCFQCDFEDNFICIQTSPYFPTLCTYSEKPKLQAKFLQIINNQQQVQITFSQQVKIKEGSQFQEHFKMHVENIEEDKQILKLDPIIQLNEALNWGEYILFIKILSNLNYKPILSFQLNQNITNSANQTIQQNDYEILLEIPQNLEEDDMQKADSLCVLNKGIMVGLGVVSVVSIFTGMADQFGEIFNILSYQQYLRYINLEFPQNLVMYFSINDLLSFDPILNFLNFDFYLNTINYETKYSDSFEKFQMYGLNSDFQTNIQSQLVQALAVLLMIPLFKNANRIKLKYVFNSRFFYYMSRLSSSISSKVAFGISKKINQFFKSLDKMKSFVQVQGIKQIFYLNSWDLIFKIYLYLFSVEYFDVKHIVQRAVGITILCIYFQFSIQDLHLMKNSAKLKQDKMKIIGKENKLQSINIFRQLLFLFILVDFQDDPKSQAILISFLSITWLSISIILLWQNLQSKSQLFVTIVVECSVCMFTLSSLIYIKDFTHLTTYQSKIFIGWVQIGLLSLGMVIQLIVTVYQQIIQLICHTKQYNQIMNGKNEKVLE